MSIHGRALVLASSAALAVSSLAVLGVTPGSAAGFGSSGTASALPAETLTATTLFPARDGVWPLAVDGDLAVGEMRVGKDNHAFAVDLTTPTPTPRDLGTLGGGYSAATAVDGSRVAGNADAADGSSHAFLLDMADATPTMRDLGAMPGWHINVEGLDGRWLVGELEGDRGIHLFVCDLAAETPTLRDLGARGLVAITAFDGPIVTGVFWPRQQEPQAFYADVSATPPRLIPMGTLAPGVSSAYSWPHDVSGRYIVGAAEGPDGSSRAFVYDVAAAVPTMRAIGRGTTEATAVDGTTVVGSRGKYRHAFIADLAAGPTSVRDLGSLGIGSEALDVDGHLVVGVASRPGDLAPRSVAYDLNRPEVGAVDIGPAWAGADHMEVSGNHVLTGTHPSSSVLGIVYTTAPSFGFSQSSVRVGENDGTATLTVQRSGTAATEASVGYVTKGGYRGDGSTDSTTPGKDFTTVTGRVSFPAGVTTRTVSVAVLDDSLVEASESLMLRLNEPSIGAVLGTPRTVEIRIRPSDQRPDLVVGPRPGGQTYDTPSRGFLGNNVYNATAQRQTLVKTAAPGQPRLYFVRLYNHGNWPGTSFTLHASPGPAHARARYLHGDTDITRALRTPAGYRMYGPSGEEWEYDSWWSLRIRVTVGPRAALGSRQAATLTATWTGDRIRSDTVRAAVRVTR